jgi:hypothetical protein
MLIYIGNRINFVPDTSEHSPIGNSQFSLAQAVKTRVFPFPFSAYLSVLVTNVTSLEIGTTAVNSSVSSIKIIRLN